MTGTSDRKIAGDLPCSDRRVGRGNNPGNKGSGWFARLLAWITRGTDRARQKGQGPCRT